MREAIKVKLNEELQNDKPIKFTHVLVEGSGWIDWESEKTDLYDHVVYLGACADDGDMFAVYKLGTIQIFKGHLNSGKY